MEKDRARQMGATVAASAGQAGAVSATAHFVCDECHRSFRRRQDIARHKCQTTRYRGGIYSDDNIASHLTQSATLWQI